MVRRRSGEGSNKSGGASGLTRSIEIERWGPPPKHINRMLAFSTPSQGGEEGLPRNIDIEKCGCPAPPKEVWKDFHIEAGVLMRLAPVFRPVCLSRTTIHINRLQAGFHTPLEPSCISQKAGLKPALMNFATVQESPA